MTKSIGIFLLVLSTINGMGKNPPGTLKVQGTSYYLDATELSNLEWYFYVIEMRGKHGKDSEEYRKALPDSATWCSVYPTDEYFNCVKSDSKYGHYPVVGITHEQANQYCIWRSELASVTYGKNVVYTLPSKEVIEMACKQSKASYKEGVYKLGKRNKISGLYDNVSELTDENGTLLSSNTSKVCLFQAENDVASNAIGIRFMARIVE